MSSKIRPLRVHDVSVVELQELGEAVPRGAAAAACAPHEHVRERRAARGPGAGTRTPRATASALRRDEVVRRARVRAVVQLVDGHVDARTAGDRLDAGRVYFEYVYQRLRTI